MARNPTKMTNHVEARVVLHRGLLSIAKPAMRHRMAAASFQPQEEESKKMPMMRKMPAIKR
jgi:hypothetical protein